MRLDPLSIPYRILQNGIRILGGLVLIAATSASVRDPLAAGVSMLGFGVLFVAAVGAWQTLYYRRFEYEVTADTVDISSGVLSRREREIPYGRIQNVDVAQNAIQRVLGIAEVRLETAGGSDTEAQLRYVSRAEADRLQELISDRKRGAATEEGEPAPASVGEELFRLEPRELAILGFVSADFRLLGLFAVLASGFAPSLADMSAPGTELLIMLGPAVAVVVLAGLWIVSGIRSMLRYWGFRLTRHGDELRYERGLLQRYNGTIPLEKVQTVTLRENVLARQLGYATLVIETAGYTAGGSAQVESAVPIGQRGRVLELARSVEPVGELDFHRPPKRARTRYAIRYSLVLGVLTAVAYGLDRFTGLVIETAGYTAGGSAQVESAVPIGQRGRVLELARSVEPVGELDFHRPPKRARTRYAIRYSLVLGVLTAVAYGLDRFTGLVIAWYLALVLLAVVPIAAHLAWANRGYALDDDYVVTRNGFWRRETAIVAYDRVQTVISSQTVFQRRRRLGSVTVDTASSGGLGSGDAVAVDVDATVADDLRETVSRRLQVALRSV